MAFLLTLLYGVVEGITEWLPVSSTGHLYLLNSFFPLDNTPEFKRMFMVVIQFGAIIAIMLTYCSQLWPFSTQEEYFVKKDTLKMWGYIGVACLPAAIIGIPFQNFFEKHFTNNFSISIALISVGIIFIIVENFIKLEITISSIQEMTIKTAFIIGLFQLVAALFPGVSRSGATIIGALLIGVSRKTATEFTFYLAVPTMLGASLYELLLFGLDFTTEEFAILAIGFMSAYFVSMLTVRFLLEYIKNHKFNVFSIYRIILGITVLVLMT